MPRTKGSKDLLGPKKGALIALTELNNLSNRRIAERYDCDKKTVRNVRKRALEAEKENIDSLSSEAY